MTRVVVAGSPNNFTVAVIDFTTPGSPSVVQVNPGYGGGSVVDIDGSNVAAGNINGSQVRLIDVSNPAAPALRGLISTTLLGIGAIAIQGTRVAVGEQNGSQITLLDFSSLMSPTMIGTKITSSGAFSSIAFLSDFVVVASSPNDFVCLQVDFTTPGSPVETTFNPALVGSPSLDADASADVVAVGDSAGVNVKLIDGATKAITGTANSTLASVDSVAVAGSLVLAGSPNTVNIARINFSGGPSVTPFNPGYGSGSITAIDGTIGASGAIVGTGGSQVKLLDLTASPPTILGSIDSGIDSIATLAIGHFSGPPPGPHLTYSPMTFSFGAVHVGVTSAPLSVSLHNTGGQPLNVSTITLSDPRFAVAPSAPFAIAPGGSASLAVTFTPTAEAAFAGTLSFTTNDPAHTHVSIPVTGTGGLPHISLLSANLDFGSVAVCLNKPLLLGIHNSGAVPLHVSSLATTGAPFTVAPASLMVGPGATANATVTFTPSVVGNAAGTLTVSSDDSAHPSLTVALAGTGLPTPPPAIGVTPPALNFGATPLQYFIGLRVTVANTSPCQPLIVNLTVSGAQFFLTGDTNPTMVPPTNMPITNVSIAGNASRGFVVIFAPTALGAAAGTLTITSNDPANPTLTIPLSGTGVTLAPAALELVLDRSGSMAAPAISGTKMDALKAAVHLFADLVIPGQGDEMGSVEFDDAVNQLTPRGPYDAAKRTAIETDADTLTPRNFTSIGGGLQLGQTELAPSASPRKVLLVFTDGLQNRPPDIGTAEPPILAAGTEVYAIGLGQPQNISVADLSALASTSHGHFFLTDDPLILRKNFVQVLADAFRHTMAADPTFTLTPGQTIDVPVQITACERRITFVLNWDDPASDVDLRIRAPNGTTFTPTAPATNQLVRYGQRPGYRYYQIAFPPLDPGSGLNIGPPELGTWAMRVTGTSLAGPSERCTASVLVESELELEAIVHAIDVSQPLQMEAHILHGGTPVDGAHVVVTLKAPQRSLAQVSTPAVRAAALQADVHPIRTGKRPLIPYKAIKRTLKPLKRGSYGLELPPPKVDGVYHVTVEATGHACGGTFQRYETFSLYIGRRPKGDRTQTTVTRTGNTTATVTVTPRDADGVPLGAGLGALLHATIAGGAVLSTRDNQDGSYSFRVVWEPRRRTPSLKVRIGDETVGVPLQVRG